LSPKTVHNRQVSNKKGPELKKGVRRDVLSQFGTSCVVTLQGRSSYTAPEPGGKGMPYLNYSSIRGQWRSPLKYPVKAWIYHRSRNFFDFKLLIRVFQKYIP